MTKEKIEVIQGSVYDSLHQLETANDLVVKADLVREILAIKQSSNLTQTELGKIINMNQADVSRMLKGNFRNIAVNKILQCLTHLNCDIQIVIKPHKGKHDFGSIEVMATA